MYLGNCYRNTCNSRMAKGIAFAVLLGSLLVACSREPTITTRDLDGIYGSDPCPKIFIKNGNIIIGEEVLKGHLINIKGDNILSTNRSVRFSETSERCIFSIVPEPIYNYIEIDNDVMSIQLFSLERTEIRRWTKTEKEIR